jgi:hypothetical protein
MRRPLDIHRPARASPRNSSPMISMRTFWSLFPKIQTLACERSDHHCYEERAACLRTAAVQLASRLFCKNRAPKGARSASLKDIIPTRRSSAPKRLFGLTQGVRELWTEVRDFTLAHRPKFASLPPATQPFTNRRPNFNAVDATDRAVHAHRSLVRGNDADDSCAMHRLRLRLHFRTPSQSMTVLIQHHPCNPCVRLVTLFEICANWDPSLPQKSGIGPNECCKARCSDGWSELVSKPHRANPPNG